MAHRPVGAGISFTFAGTATTSSDFTVKSDVVRIVASGGAAHVAIGTNPTVTTADYYVPSGTSVTLALTKASNRIVGVITGTTTIVYFPEGTQAPFGVGDYVTLTASGQSYYDFAHKEVLSVDTSVGTGGYYQRRMTVNYDTSGITTSFFSPDAIMRTSQKLGAIGAEGGSGVIYAQQVQVTGQA